MSIGAIIFGILSIAMTWGGFGVCLYIAVRTKQTD